MNIRLSNFSHWRILWTSAFLLLAAVVFARDTRKTTTPTVVFFQAVYRPTINRLVDQLRQNHKQDVSIVFCSLSTAEQAAAQSRESGETWITPCTWQGAKKLASASIIVTADRLRTLGIVLRLTSVPFIDVWHGISFKTIKRARFLRHYKEVWVASDFLAGLYQKHFGVPAEKLVATGFSPSDSLVTHSHVFTSPSPATSPRNIVIAPTWTPRSLGAGKGQEPDYFWADYHFLNTVAETMDVRFTIRAHFLDSLTQATTSPTTRVTFVPQSQEPDPSPVLASADALVTDWSSLAFEFLPTEKPIIFLENSHNRPRRFLIPPEFRWGPIVHDREEFVSALRDALSRDGGTAHSLTARAVETLFPDDLKGVAGQVQAERLENLLRLATTTP